jgi:prepilin-type N-terminal cleavage/methylation domain-containing protein/prepilin-type processing-associated H-X9-DG protein
MDAIKSMNCICPPVRERDYFFRSMNPLHLRSKSIPQHVFSCAFSLVELLVVIAIIAVLAAVSVPIASNFASKGKESSTASRLRQVHIVNTAYAADNNGRLAMFFSKNSPSTWQEKLIPYVQSQGLTKEDPRLVLNSPYQAAKPGKTLAQSGRSFGMNNFMMSGRWDFFLARVESPSRIIMAGDMEQGNTDYMHTSDGRDTWGATASWGLPAYRHAGKKKAMMVFMDGHTELLGEEELKLTPSDGSASRWRWWQ